MLSELSGILICGATFGGVAFQGHSTSTVDRSVEENDDFRNRYARAREF